MTPRRSFTYKVIYLVAIAVLLGPLFLLSQPAAPELGEGTARAAGGMLARLRTQFKLSEAMIGRIDPTSETIRLASLGMRGVAANILWEKANRYKMKKDWTGLKAALNQLIHLEPHFITVWRHQAWNLSYNVSAEFDDYRGRYHWVIQGIRFLQEGIRYNEHSPHLVWDVGWFIAQKIGRADEHKLFRRLFRADDDFHGSRPLDARDNWLVGKEWFKEAEDRVRRGDSLKQTSPVLFYSDAPMCQMNYAEALETDGVFQERAKRAWTLAGEEWHQFGAMELPTTSGEKIRLNDREMFLAQASEARAKLEAIEPNLREKLVQERRKKMERENPKKLRALDTPPDKRTREQWELATLATAELEIRPEEIARRIKDDRKRDQGRKLADAINQSMHMENLIGRYREIVNFEYWRLRARVEQTDEAIAAREAFYNGDQVAKLDPLGAQEHYAKGFAHWRKVLDKVPELGGSDAFFQQIKEVLERYVKVLDHLDEVFPPDFPLAQHLRSRVEQQPAYLDARTAAADAQKALAKGDLPGARRALEKSFTSWRAVLDNTPGMVLMSDRKSCEELMAAISSYAQVLEKLKEPFPEEFALQDFLRIQIQHAEGTRQARELVAKADQARDQQQFAEARTHYEQGLAAWRKVLDRFPRLIRTCDRKSNLKLVEVIDRYAGTLKVLEEQFPKDFILQDVLEAFKKDMAETQPKK